VIVGWLLSQSVSNRHLDDRVQEIFMAICRGLQSSGHGGREAALRGWLRAVTPNPGCQ
jgi:DNA-directed RNA polymerase specialized sigma24 family protein